MTAIQKIILFFLAVVITAAWSHAAPAQTRLHSAGKISDSSNLIGMNVVGRTGESLGTVEDVVLDLNAGHVTFLLLSLGNNAGAGGRVAIPPGSFRFDPDKNQLVLNADSKAIESAPRFDGDEYSATPERAAVAEAYKYYDENPYWKERNGSVKLIGLGNVNKASNAIGLEVVDPSGEELGKVADVGINLAEGRIAYVLLSSGGVLGVGDKIVAVPATRLRFTGSNDKLVMNSSRQQLEAAPAFAREEWAHLESPEYGAEVTQYYADNTGVNERDRNTPALTPTDQSNKETDIKITQNIRKQIMDDKSLSLYAQNVKIITVNGVVTLRGPVKSPSERRTIGTMAKRVSGVKKVNNQTEVDAKQKT